MMPKPKGFRLDMSAETGVVVCRDCGWRGLVFHRGSGGGRLSAWRQAASHERRAHPGQKVASAALSITTTRRTKPSVPSL